MYLLMLLQLFGVQFNNPWPDKIEIVRADQAPHHWILDNSNYSHLMPWTVNIKTHEKGVHTLTVVFTVTFADGSSQDYGRYQTMPPGVMMIKKNESASFWPGGWMPNLPGSPIMNESPINWNNVQSMTFHIDYIEFEDGTIDGPDKLDTRGQIERHRIYEQRRRR